MAEAQHHSRRFTDVGYCGKEDCPHLSEIEASTKGVSNFRAFSLDMTEKMAFVHGAAKVWSIVLSAVLTVMFGITVWMFHEVYPAFRQIMADYYIHHPDARLQEKSTSSSNKTLEVKNNTTQHTMIGR